MTNRGAWSLSERIRDLMIRRRIRPSAKSDAGDIYGASPVGDLARIGMFGQNVLGIDVKPSQAAAWLNAITFDPITGIPTFPQAGYLRYDVAQTPTAAQIAQAYSNIGLTTALRGYIDGLALVNDGGTPNTKIDVNPGACRDSTNAVTMSLGVLSGCDCTTVGANGLDAGALANSTWYHVYMIAKADGTMAVIASTNATTPSFPSGFVYKRRLGSFKTDGSAHILGFIQDGDIFRWKTPVADVNGVVNPGITAVTRALASVPLGIRVQAHVVAILDYTASAAGSIVYLSDLSCTDVAAGTSAASMGTYLSATFTEVSATGLALVMTDTSQQVRSRLNLSTANTTIWVITLGWMDQRGKNA